MPNDSSEFNEEMFQKFLDYYPKGLPSIDQNPIQFQFHLRMFKNSLNKKENSVTTTNV